MSFASLLRARQQLFHSGFFALCPVQRVFLDVCFIGFKSAGGVLDKFLIGQPGGDNFAAHGIRQRNVRAHVKAQPHV